jgi:MYXO-CTERM domain-containing protein
MAVLPATGPLTVSTDRLPSAYVDVTYRVELAAVGGIPPYTWTIIGRPPQGISLKNNTLTGIPEIPDGSADATTFKVQVRDSRGTTAERELALPVLQSADLSIQTTRIQDGLVGQPYQQIIRAAGGEPPYEFTITGLQGTGLAPNSNSDTTALISGIPESAGYFEMTVVVKDQTQQQATQRFKFAVSGQAIQVQTDRALPLALPGKEYPATQLVSGTTDVNWEIYSGEMPAGVVLSEDGILSGTVEATAKPRTYTFLVRAYDAKGGEGYGSFSILLQAKKLPLNYKVTKTGCGSNAAGGSPSAFLLPVLGAAFLLLRRRRS